MAVPFFPRSFFERKRAVVPRLRGDQSATETVSAAHKNSSPLYRHWGSVQAVRPIGGVEV